MLYEPELSAITDDDLSRAHREGFEAGLYYADDQLSRAYREGFEAGRLAVQPIPTIDQSQAEALAAAIAIQFATEMLGAIGKSINGMFANIPTPPAPKKKRRSKKADK